MSNATTAVVKKDDKVMEFVPYGGSDKIKLSIAIVQNLIAVKTKSGKTCTEQDAIKFMMMCSARRLNPFEGDAFLIGYDGREGATFSLITAHQAFLKRAECNPEFDGMKSGIIISENDEMKDLEGDFYTDGQTLLGGWAKVFFKNRREPMSKRIRLKRFSKDWGIWKDDPAGMICKCAEADALRSSFPTMLGGLYLREEIIETSKEKIAAPIFQSVPQAALESPPASVTTTPLKSSQSNDPVATVRRLCKQDGISEEQMVKFLITVGLADEGNTSLDDVPLEQLPIVIDQWDEMSAKAKEAA